MIQLHNRSLRKCYAWIVALALLITSFSTSVSAETATDIIVQSSTLGAVSNSLQCGSATSINGYAMKKIDGLTSDDYYISYNYMYPSGRNMALFWVWSSFDEIAKEYDDIKIVQSGKNLKVALSTGVNDTDVMLEPDTWYYIVIHCKADNTVEFFVNGKQALIGNNYSVPQIGKGRMTSIGALGDPTESSSVDGCGYFDNIRVISENTVIAAENFDEGLIGWTTTGTCSLSDKNCEPPILDTVVLDTGWTSLSIGESTGLTISAKFQNGLPVILGTTNGLTYSSSNPSVLKIVKDGYGATATALSEGTATVTAAVTMYGQTKQAVAEFSVTTAALTTPSAITLSAGRTNLLTGDKSKLALFSEFSNGSRKELSAADVNFESSNEGVVKVNFEGGFPYAVAAAPGSATITASTTQAGISMQDVLTFTVMDPGSITSSKTRSTYYSEQKVAFARSNIQKYEWAKNIRDGAIKKAEPYLQLDYDVLWNLVTPQSIPRSYAVNQPLGCLNCGKEIDKYGNYPYKANQVNEPWVLTCPNCNMKFPTNDFNAFYESGKDQYGIFKPELADRSLLKNTRYPEKGENWGVDDGMGYRDANNNNYTFIAYYNHWSLWYQDGIINTALNSLRDAYIYTGDIKYSRAGIILLDRIADVYPEMDLMPYKVADGFWNGNGHSNRGKVLGCIPENFLVKDFLKAYDAFFPAMDDPGALAYLSGKSDIYELGILKKTTAGLRKNVEDGIVRQVFPAVKESAIRGNNGMHQSSLALAAVVLDTFPETKDWLDFNFKTGAATDTVVTGGNILATLVDDIDRDGNGNESSPGYNRLWLSQFYETANILNGYDGYPAADLYDNVKFRKMFYAMYPLTLTDLYSANIGDNASTGSSANFVDKEQTIMAFEQYGTPILAQLIYFLNGSQTDGIHGDIFSSDPEKMKVDIKNIIDTYGELKLGDTNLTGYGFTALRDGDITRKVLGIVYRFPELKVTDMSVQYKVFDSSGTIQLEATKPGDYITFNFNVQTEDEYEIDLKPFKAGSYGQYDVILDGQKISNFDFFGGSGVNSDYEVLGVKRLTAGEHTISFVCTGKNESSSNYKAGMIQLVLLNSEAQERKESGADTQRAMWLYYGRNTSHGHRDTLNLGLAAFKLDLSPDLGYPEFADASDNNRQWVTNTVSHNTVIVNKSRQNSQVVSQPKHFDGGEMVKLIDVEAPEVYSDVSQYRRTSAMIKVDGENSYYVDFFRVSGGDEHHFSFHGAEGAVATEGLDLVPQVDANGQYVGTYAGPDVEFGVRPLNDSVTGVGYTGPGFHWLKNVDKDDNPSDKFSVDWNVKDTWNIYGMGASAQTDVHMRLTMLGQMDDVAITDGVPPRNKPGNPSILKYLIAHRSGENLQSLFTSVIEPYKAERYIKSIDAVELTAGGSVVSDEKAKALKVTFENGRVDYIVNALDTNITYTVDGKFQFKGFFGVYSEMDGKHLYSYINDGETINSQIADANAKLTGIVTGFTKEMSSTNEITVRFSNQNSDVDDLAGRYIYIDNDGIRNASYRINGVKSRNGDTLTLDIGDITPIRKWMNPYDFSKGFIYDFVEGAAFEIPLSVEVIAEKPGQKQVLVSITTPAAITGVPNGTAKNAVALGLPLKVELKATTEGAIEVIEADVTWNVANSSYNPFSEEAQTFTVEGTVLLPTGVVNTNNIPLTVSSSVTVEAAERPVIPSPTDPNPGNNTGTTPKPTTEEPKTQEYENPFADVDGTEWFYDSVMYVYNHGLMAGVSTDKFNPLENGSRGMIVTILYTLEGRPGAVANRFKDVADGKWYTEAIAWAAENKVVKGYGNGMFGPNDIITREQMATIFYNYAKHKGYDLSKTSSLERFVDSAKASDWASEALQWMVGSGMMSGKGNNILDPKGTATRAEMASIMRKFMEEYGE